MLTIYGPLATCTCKIRVFTSARCRGSRLLLTALRSSSISTSSVVLLASSPPQTEQVQQAEVERHAHSPLQSPRVREAVATALDDTSKVQWNTGDLQTLSTDH